MLVSNEEGRGGEKQKKKIKSKNGIIAEMKCFYGERLVFGLFYDCSQELRQSLIFSFSFLHQAEILLK